MPDQQAVVGRGPLTAGAAIPLIEASDRAIAGCGLQPHGQFPARGARESCSRSWRSRSDLLGELDHPHPAIFWTRTVARLLISGSGALSRSRIAGCADDLARARRVADLGAAAALPDRRAERRHRVAEPDLDFREFCRRSELPQSERSWDLFAAECYRRGETDNPSYEAYNPFRHRQQGDREKPWEVTQRRRLAGAVANDGKRMGHRNGDEALGGLPLQWRCGSS